MESDFQKIIQANAKVPQPIKDKLNTALHEKWPKLAKAILKAAQTSNIRDVRDFLKKHIDIETEGNIQKTALDKKN